MEQTSLRTSPLTKSLLRAGAVAALALSICACKKSSSEVDIPGELAARYALGDDAFLPGMKHYLSASFETRTPTRDVIFDQGERITANGLPLEHDGIEYVAAAEGAEPASYLFELDAGERGVFSHEVTFSPRFSVLSPAEGAVLSPDDDIVVQLDEALPGATFNAWVDFPSMGTEVVVVESVQGALSESDPTRLVFPAALLAERYDFVAASPGAPVNAELRISRSTAVPLEDPSPYLEVEVITSRWAPRVPITLQR